MPKFQYVKTGDFEAPTRFKTKGRGTFRLT